MLSLFMAKFVNDIMRKMLLFAHVKGLVIQNLKQKCFVQCLLIQNKIMSLQNRHVEYHVYSV